MIFTLTILKQHSTGLRPYVVVARLDAFVGIWPYGSTDGPLSDFLSVRGLFPPGERALPALADALLGALAAYPASSSNRIQIRKES